MDQFNFQISDEIIEEFISLNDLKEQPLLNNDRNNIESGFLHSNDDEKISPDIPDISESFSSFIDIDNIESGLFSHSNVDENILPHIPGSTSEINNGKKPTPKRRPISPKRKKLIKENRNLKAKLKRLQKRELELMNQNIQINKKQFEEACDQFLPTNSANFVKLQIQMSDRKLRGARYPNHFKKFCLSIYFLSPKAYAFMRKVFQLPAKSTLNHMTTNWQYTPGLQDALFETIKIKVDRFNEMDRHTLLCFDEICIKKHTFYNIATDEIIGLEKGKKGHVTCTNHAMVLMAKGLTGKWKQPLAYYFCLNSYSDGDIKQIMEKCVRKLNGIGLNVRGLVSDMGKNFYSASLKSKCLTGKLGITPEKPYFELDGKKLYYFLDTPHLLKATRTNLMTNVFEINGEKSSWNYIRQFYEKDSKSNFKKAPKLTLKHIEPTNFERMKVKLATQIMSASVAAGMRTQLQLKELPPEAKLTIEIIDKFDKLFDMLNSLNFKTTKKFNKPFTGDDYQINFLNEMLEYIKSIKITHCSKDMNKTNIVSFLTGWQVTIKSTMLLWEDVKHENFKFLLTRRINQDCVENFFSKIRQANGCCVNPTPIQFIRSFKKLFSTIFLNVSEGSNCEDDFDMFLTKINSMGKGF